MTDKNKRPYFLAPEVERVLVVSMTVAQELAVARARIDTLERLLERKGVVTRAEIETFEPTAAEASQRNQWMQEYLARVLRILEQQAEHPEASPEASGS
jgi:gamma-glutamyl phosphate reductase